MKNIFKSLVKISAAIFLVALSLNINRIGGTNSSFSNSETSLNNSFTAGEWGEELFVLSGSAAPDESLFYFEETDGQTEEAPADVLTDVSTDVIASDEEIEETLPPVD